MTAPVLDDIELAIILNTHDIHIRSDGCGPGSNAAVMPGLLQVAVGGGHSGTLCLSITNNIAFNYNHDTLTSTIRKCHTIFTPTVHCMLPETVATLAKALPLEDIEDKYERAKIRSKGLTPHEELGSTTSAPIDPTLVSVPEVAPIKIQRIPIAARSVIAAQSNGYSSEEGDIVFDSDSVASSMPPTDRSVLVPAHRELYTYGDPSSRSKGQRDECGGVKSGEPECPP
jgi:hypothetical protein